MDKKEIAQCIYDNADLIENGDSFFEEMYITIADYSQDVMVCYEGMSEVMSTLKECGLFPENKVTFCEAMIKKDTRQKFVDEICSQLSIPFLPLVYIDGEGYCIITDANSYEYIESIVNPGYRACISTSDEIANILKNLDVIKYLESNDTGIMKRIIDYCQHLVKTNWTLSEFTPEPFSCKSSLFKAEIDYITSKQAQQEIMKSIDDFFGN